LPPGSPQANTPHLHFAALPNRPGGLAGVQIFCFFGVKSGGSWSPVPFASTLTGPMLPTGNPPLLCGQGSSAGNFGTLKLSNHVGGGMDNMGAANVALGLDHTLAPYPVAGRLPDGTCSSSQTTSVLWPSEGTNCVDTDTGMSSKVATDGFVKGGSWGPGLLAKSSYDTRCGPGGTPAWTVWSGTQINNDVLTCFFTDPALHIADVANKSYAGGPVFSSDIYSSPRFGYVPVLPVQPANGGSKNYQIIDFRPAFITDQPASAMKGDGPGTANNGLINDKGKARAVQVVFLNARALPPPPVTGGTVAYTGAGPRVPLLVD